MGAYPSQVALSEWAQVTAGRDISHDTRSLLQVTVVVFAGVALVVVRVVFVVLVTVVVEVVLAWW